MSRLQAIQSDAATGKAKELLDAVQAKLKITPNMTRVMANSPAVLEAYLGFSGALSHGALDAKLREEIALEVGEQNSCQYRVPAHTAIADVEAVRPLGFTDGEIAEIIAHVALNVFTNYFNNTAGVEVDFPKIALRQSA
jgi:AhpD family alkylhydroperoxidase